MVKTVPRSHCFSIPIELGPAAVAVGKRHLPHSTWCFRFAKCFGNTSQHSQVLQRAWKKYGKPAEKAKRFTSPWYGQSLAFGVNAAAKDVSEKFVKALQTDLVCVLDSKPSGPTPGKPLTACVAA